MRHSFVLVRGNFFRGFESSKVDITNSSSINHYKNIEQAGKSSLVGSLLRIAKTEGKIEIDAIDTSQIDLSQLRSKISIIPQDPCKFLKTLQ
jgi:ABC-type transport system involved in Fe-S cluster assembly fused permease/ATPase subunit